MENLYFSKPWLIWIHYLQIHASNYNALNLYYAGRHRKDDRNMKSFVFRHKINMEVSRTSILKRWIAYLLIWSAGTVGQSCVLQYSKSPELPGQSSPPFAGFGLSQILDLDFLPLAHDFVQSPQFPHAPQAPSTKI